MKKIFSAAGIFFFVATLIILQNSFSAGAQTSGGWALDASNNVVTALGIGNVGIKTTQPPDRPLTIQGSGGLVSFKDASGQTRWHLSNFNGNWALVQTGVGTPLSVGSQTGVVGIGMDSPDPLAKLDVNGAIRVRGSINENVVTSPGMIYYNGTKLRCNEGGAWKDCVVGGGSGGGIGNDVPSPNVLPKWTTSGNAFLVNSNITDSGTQVSISKPVSITGNVSVAGTLSVTGGAATTCQSGQVLSGIRIQGGVVTAGTCSDFVSSTPGFSFFTTDPTAPSAGRLLTTGGVNHLAVGATGNFRDTVSLTVRSRPGTTGWIQLQDAQGNNRWHFTEFGGGFSFVETGIPGGDGRFFIKSGTGYVGMGTINPAARLELSSAGNNMLRLRRSTLGSIDVFTAVGSGTGDSLCGAPATAACVAAFNSARSSISCSESGAIRALCAAVAD